MQGKGLIFVISGPSGSGKTTLLKALFKSPKLDKRLVKSVSLTTRPARSGEKNGKDYFFITEKEFKQRQKAKKILEWTKYLGYYYATPKELLEGQLKKAKSVILCLDLKGALRIKKLYPDNTRTIFIIPPSIKMLRGRIEGRCSKTQKSEINNRLKLAKKEISAWRKYDYSIVNESLDKARNQLKQIVLEETGI